MSELVVVLGGGESGVGAAVLAKVKGFDVLLSDKGSIAKEYKDVLLKYEIEWEEGKHSEDRILSARTVVKSPGIPDHVALIQALIAADIEVISEIEWASRFTKARLIGITGSNGKTTTTSLIYHLLSRVKPKVGLAGNIGKSFAFQVAVDDQEVYVLELSSFQLDGIQELKLDAAVLLNITADHLDRYNYDVLQYAASKMRIINRADGNSFFTYFAEDELIYKLFNRAAYPGALVSFGVDRGDFQMKGSMLDCGSLAVAMDELKLEGKHNALNVMAAVAVAKNEGLQEEEIVTHLKTFGAIEHRLEEVRTVNGVRYINDSKATNVDAVYYALDAMTQPCVWIVGGVDKGNDYSVLESLVKEKVKAVICLGKDNEKLIKEYKEMLPVEEALSAEEAVYKAGGYAEDGDTVLLSPACASFDLFNSYEDRGKQFKQVINNL